MFNQSNKSTVLRLLYLIVVHFLFSIQVFCQVESADSLSSINKDSLVLETTVDTVNIVYNDGDIDGPINYQAADSIVYDLANQMLYLYGSAYMKYTDIELNSHEIDYDWTTGTLTSRGKIGEDGELESGASFSEKSWVYEADSMQYNFKTGKGRTYAVVTEQDGAYIHSEIVQKNEFD